MMMKTAASCVLGLLAGAVIAAPKDFGKLSDGREAKVWRIVGEGGLVVDVTDYGGRIVRVYAPDRHGNLDDVALGWNTAAEYEKYGYSMGTLIGRYGNRIADGKFVLDGKTYELECNETSPAPRHCNLHGGPKGWDSCLWKVRETKFEGAPALELVLESPDGDQGFPGNVAAKVTYTLTPENVWRIEYEAVPDKATPINLTQHIYFNFHGEAEGTILDHDLTLFADKMTPVDAGLIPTGEITPVAGTPFDFTTPHKIGERVDTKGDKQLEYGNGYDHNFVLTNPSKGGELSQAAALYEEKSGRYMEVWTTEPGIQFYCGNFLTDKMIGKQGKAYQFRGGLALETQHYPDSPNQPNFPSTIVQPGQVYKTTTEYRFGTK